MRGLQLLSIMILGLSCPIAHALESSLTEDQKPTAPPQVNLDLKHVIYKSEQQAKAIDSDIRLYSVIKQDIDTAGSEGGTLTAYYAANSLRKVVVTYYAEMGQIEYQYYRGKQGLFLVAEQTSRYNKPMYLADSKIKTVLKKRYYYAQGRFLTGRAATGQPIKPETDLLSDFASFRLCLESCLNLKHEN